jgi:hypothetical protein
MDDKTTGRRLALCPLSPGRQPFRTLFWPPARLRDAEVRRLISGGWPGRADGILAQPVVQRAHLSVERPNPELQLCHRGPKELDLGLSFGRRPVPELLRGI